MGREGFVSSAMTGNIWWFGVFGLSAGRKYKTLVRACPRLGDRDWGLFTEIPIHESL